MHGDDLAVFILFAAGAFDHIAVFQPHLVAGEEAEVALGGHFHEVFFFDPQFLGDREAALAAFRVVGVDGGVAVFGEVFREVVDDEFQRAQHGDGARGLGVEVVAHCGFEHAVVGPAVGLGGAGAVAEELH